MNFQNGDIVRLKSGSPDLIIINSENPNAIQIAFWSTSDTKISSVALPSFALELVKTGYLEEETETLEGMVV